MSEPVRVVRVIGALPIGGVEQKILESLPLFDPRAFRFEIVCLRERGVLADELERRGIPVHLRPMKGRLHPASIRALAGLFRERSYAIVHTHMYRSNTSGTVAARLAGMPVVISQIHNICAWDTRRQLWMDRRLVRFKNAIIAVSRAVADDYLLHVPAARSKLHVIHNGVNTHRFRFDQDQRLGLRREWGVGTDETIFGIIGRLVPQKGHHILIDALLRMQNENTPLPSIIIAGAGSEDARLQERVRQLGLTGKVRFLGMRRDVPTILSALDGVILPSSREGFANVILEAMAAGRAVIASDVGGNAEVIEDGLTGRLIPNGDVNALAAAITELMACKEKRENLGRNACRRVNDFSLEKMTRAVADLYTGLWNAARKENRR